jgi:acetyl esterase/lipase
LQPFEDGHLGEEAAALLAKHLGTLGEPSMNAAGRPKRGLIGKLIGLVIRLVLLLIIVTTIAWIAMRPVTPDAFYSHALPQDAALGTLLKSEPFTKAIPTGSKGWRILYITTRGGMRALASAVVVVPEGSGIARPVIAWAHGTTGIVDGCAPSLLEKPFDNVPDINAIVREGWAYVGTDYPGLGTGGGHAYLVGADAARAVLDSVRAARQLKGTNLGDRIVVWGHSQGGNSALWTGMRAIEFAPELQVIGVAALAPASDLKGLMQASKSSMFGKIVSSYVITAYAQAYQDVKVDDYVGLGPRVIAGDISKRCVAGYQTLFPVLETYLLPADGIFRRDPTLGPLGTRLGENTPANIVPSPLLIAQGEIDDLVLPEVQKRYANARCSAGQRIDFRTYPGRDHVSVVAPDSPLAPELIQWTRDRFEGKPAKNTCQ